MPSKFRFRIGTGFQGCDVSEVVLLRLEGLEGKAREEEIRARYEEWVWNQLDSSWSELEEGDLSEEGDE